MVGNPDPGIIFNSRQHQPPRVLQPGSIGREINTGVSITEEENDKDPFVQVMLQGDIRLSTGLYENASI